MPQQLAQTITVDWMLRNIDGQPFIEPANLETLLAGSRFTTSQSSGKSKDYRRRRRRELGKNRKQAIDLDFVTRLFKNLATSRGAKVFTAFDMPLGQLPTAMGMPDQQHPPLIITHQNTGHQGMQRSTHASDLSSTRRNTLQLFKQL